MICGSSHFKAKHISNFGKLLTNVIPPLQPHSFIHFLVHSLLQCEFSAEWDRMLISFPVPSLFLKVIQQLLTSFSSSSRYLYLSLYPSISNVFQKAVPTHDVTNPVNSLHFIVYSIFLSSLTLILIHFSQDRPK